MLVAILLFDPKKLPEMGRALGEGIKDFKKAMKEVTSDSEKTKTGN